MGWRLSEHQHLLPSFFSLSCNLDGLKLNQRHILTKWIIQVFCHNWVFQTRAQEKKLLCMTCGMSRSVSNPHDNSREQCALHTLMYFHCAIANIRTLLLDWQSLIWILKLIYNSYKGNVTELIYSNLCLIIWDNIQNENISAHYRLLCLSQVLHT